MYKQLFLFGCCITGLFLFAQACTKQKTNQIIVSNVSAVVLKDKPIVISRSKFPEMKEGVYPVISSAEGTVPSQLDDTNGDNKWDELFFVANLQAKGETVFTVKWVAEKPVYVKRTSVRFGKRSAADSPVEPALSETVYAKELPKSLGYQRYQTDGPSWENDKVGFRHYLDGRNAKDVFGKLIPDISPEKVGINAKGEVEDNYHVMENWGRDILAVGNSIGIGGVALLKGDTPLRLGVTADDAVNNVEKTTFNIVSEGPVRSILNFTYSNWKPEGHSYNVEETTSIWPGMYAYHNSVKMSGLEKNEDLAIGLVNINAENQPVVIKVSENWVALISHERHTYNKEWWLGLALIVPAKSYLGFIEAPKTGKLATTFLARVKIKNNEPVNYYAVAGWESSDQGFKDPAYFKQYVLNLVNQISTPLNITVK